MGQTGTVEYLAIKFAHRNGALTTVLLDLFAAAAMRAAIDSLDQIAWDGNALRPRQTEH